MGSSKARFVKGHFYAYRALRWLLVIATRVFFQRIEVVGRESLPNPENSAIILCGNHPNSLLDPVLITAWCGRIVHFAAKDVLFSVPILGWLLRLMGAVAIRRRMDHGGGTQSNDDSFKELRQVLFDGGAMGIFPEGISHDQSQIQPLKTGAARIALGALLEGCSKPVYLVPVGLVYFTRSRFRSSVLVQFGDPIALDASTIDDSVSEKQVRELTETLDARIRDLTVNAETWENLWVLDGVRRLYEPTSVDLSERTRLARRFNESYPKVKDRSDVQQLYDHVRAYLLRLSAANLDDTLALQGLGLPQIGLRMVAHLVLLFVSLPLFLVGAPIFLPIGLALKLAGIYIAPRADAVATTKFVLGFLLILALYAGGLTWTFFHFGLWWTLLAAIIVPSSGGAVIHVISRVDALRHLALTTIRIFSLRKELRELRAERKALVSEVQTMVDKYRDLDPVE